MRVIAGSRKRLQLHTIPGKNTRPTTDRIKETLFNMIQDDLPDAQFLDVFAGSGQIGIEALSRGASCAYFIENNRLALDCIRRNLSHTNFTEESCVLTGDAMASIISLEGRMQFDIIFVDPPYQAGYEKEVLQSILAAGILAEDGYVIVESLLATDFSFASSLGYRILLEKKYKTNKHVFLAKDESL